MTGPSAVHGSLVSLRVVRGDARAPRVGPPDFSKIVYATSMYVVSRVSSKPWWLHGFTELLLVTELYRQIIGPDSGPEIRTSI